MEPQKRCNQCKQDKDMDEFSTYRSKGIERIQTYCKPCKKLVGRKYYQNNKEKYKQNFQRFIEKNPSYQMEYQNKNRKYFRDYMKIRYQINKVINQLMSKLKTNMIINSNSMKEIIGCDIDNLIKWLHFTKQYNIEQSDSGTERSNNETVVIEHLNSGFNFDLNNENEIKKYMNWKNLRLMTKSQNSKKNKNFNLEDKIRHQYLLHCFIYNKEPTIEAKNIY